MKAKKGTVGFVLVFLAVAVVVWIVSSSTRQENPSGLSDNRSGPSGESVGNRVGDLAPDFSVIDYAGGEVLLSDFAGKPVVINFWATWCPFCVDELPLFARVQEELGDSYVTLAVDRAESVSRARGYTDDLGVSDSLVFVIDGSDRAYSRYGGFSMPYTVFVDQDGVIRDTKQGPLTEPEFRRRLKSILPENSSLPQEASQ